MENKIYCENCKYLSNNIRRFIYQPIKYFCKAPENLKESKSVIYKDFIFKNNPEDLNKNRSCVYYKRKWWKFGVVK